MKLIIEKDKQTGQSQYLTFMQFPLRIGRAFDNDVILPDGFVSAHHLEIEKDDQGFTIKDKSSENGTQINNTPLKTTAQRITSGDVLLLGQTELTLYTSDHKIIPTDILKKGGAFTALIESQAGAWALFLTAIGIVAVWTVLDVWSDQPGATAAFAACGMAGMIVLWAGVWAMAGRKLRHKSAFLSHVAIFSLYVIFSALLSYLQGIIDFVLSENIAAHIFSYASSFIVLAGLVAASLFFATTLSRKQRYTAGITFAAGLIGMVLALSVIGAKEFDPQPSYAARLRPYFWQVVPLQSPAEFMAENTKLLEKIELPLPEEN